jgi:hypothetical protein
MGLRQSRGGGSKQLRQLVPGIAQFLLGRAFRRLFLLPKGAHIVRVQIGVRFQRRGFRSPIRARSRESESKEEPDLLWTPESESKGESDLLWVGESDLAGHLLSLDL